MEYRVILEELLKNIRIKVTGVRLTLKVIHYSFNIT